MVRSALLLAWYLFFGAGARPSLIVSVSWRRVCPSAVQLPAYCSPLRALAPGLTRSHPLRAPFPTFGLSSRCVSPGFLVPLFLCAHAFSTEFTRPRPRPSHSSALWKCNWSNGGVVRRDSSLPSQENQGGHTPHIVDHYVLPSLLQDLRLLHVVTRIYVLRVPQAAYTRGTLALA